MTTNSASLKVPPYELRSYEWSTHQWGGKFCDQTWSYAHTTGTSAKNGPVVLTQFFQAHAILPCFVCIQINCDGPWVKCCCKTTWIYHKYQVKSGQSIHDHLINAVFNERNEYQLGWGDLGQHQLVNLGCFATHSSSPPEPQKRLQRTQGKPAIFCSHLSSNVITVWETMKQVQRCAKIHFCCWWDLASNLLGFICGAGFKVPWLMLML